MKKSTIVLLGVLGLIGWAYFPPGADSANKAAYAVDRKPAAAPHCFAIEKFKSRVTDTCRTLSCPQLYLTGLLKNNCTVAAGAQVQVVALDASGAVVATVEGWPASISTIAPGDSRAFDMGYGITYSRIIKNFQARVIDTRTW